MAKKKKIPVLQNENALPSLDGNGIVLMIFSIWLRVDDPGNKGFPPSISPRIHPRDHMSTPFVYLGINHKQLTLLNVLVSLSLCSQTIIYFYQTCT